MIYVDRSVEALPEALVGEQSDGEAECRRWREYYDAIDRGEDARKPAGFRAYKKVRKELERLFHRKCAYCEMRAKVTGHGDIEHWRPKSAIRRADGSHTERGYWWRAADWNNLLLSCALCNQPPGKGTKFPIADEGDRAQCPEAEPNETPLLLDPTVDHPEEHLTVGTSGERRGLMIAIDQPNSAPSGQATIEVFRLNRPDLVKERRELLVDLIDLVRDVRRLLLRLDAAEENSAAAVAVFDELAPKLARLRTVTGPDQEFLLLRRKMVDPLLRDAGLAPPT